MPMLAEFQAELEQRLEALERAEQLANTSPFDPLTRSDYWAMLAVGLILPAVVVTAALITW